MGISILSLGRPEVLRSLRHYQWGQSQGHHTIEHLERGTERGSVWQPFLKGWDRAIVNQVNIVSWKMWSTEELETLPMGTKPRPPHHRSPGQMSRKRKCLMTFLERTRQSHCQSGEHWNHFEAAKTMWRKFLKGGAELFRAQRIPSWTERNWRWGFKSWFMQQPSSTSPYFWGGKQVSSPSDESKKKRRRMSKALEAYAHWRSYSNGKMPWQNSAEIPPLINTD